MKANLQLGRKELPLHLFQQNLTQNVRVLNYSLPALKDYLNLKLSENPFLEEVLREPNDPEEFLDIEKEKIFKDEKKEYLKNLEYDYVSNTKSVLSFKSASEVIEATLVQKKSLVDELQEQLSYTYVPDSKHYEIGSYLISSLDKKGFLSSEVIGKAEEQFGKLTLEVWAKIKTFSPSGIGASNLEECLLLQLDLLEGNQAVAKHIIERYFPLVLKKKNKEIAKNMGLDIALIEKAIKTISFLEFNPSRKYSQEPLYITPDVLVVEKNEGLAILINDEEIPKITFAKDYFTKIKATKKKSNEKFKNYISEKKIEAKSLLYSLRYRNINLIRVSSYLVEKQKRFFLKGESAIVFDTLTLASEELGIDLSVLSRLVNKKYIDTRWGIFPLRYFFSSRIKEGNKSVSSNKIKSLIKKIIENTQQVKLSDQKIVNILKEKGYSISRRTVAKYRGSMKILSSYERKESV